MKMKTLLMMVREMNILIFVINSLQLLLFQHKERYRSLLLYAFITLLLYACITLLLLSVLFISIIYTQHHDVISQQTMMMRLKMSMKNQQQVK